jgi:predicted type IV restriction endonuclease
MTTGYEDAKAALDELINWHGEHANDLDRNEDTTRVHLVDTIIRDVLSWPAEEITTEDNYEGKYVDYSLGRPATRMIVEAKRESAHFGLPVGMTSLIHRLPSLIENPQGGRELKAALVQAAGYCAARGVQLAVICNGTQLVAFLGVRTDSTPPLEGSALVFTSLSAMRENFHFLWHNLSRYGVEARNLHVTLREDELPTAPPPLATQIPHYPGHKRRNDIQTGLQILADLFLEDITRDPLLQEDFLRDTYATSGALSQYALVSKTILENRYSLLHEPDVDLETEPVLSKRGMKSEVNPKLREDILASSISRRPIILLGDVGVGKTMFIRRLIHVDAKEVFDQSIVGYVDFGSSATLTADLGEFVISEIETQLLDNYNIDIQERTLVEAVYHKDLKRFDGTVYGELKEFDPVGYRRERLNFLSEKLQNKEGHLRASLNHIRATMRRQVVIFLDNIDQWDSEFQERVFLMAETLAQTWPATVFVSLRPDTFYRSRAEGTLAAYQPRAFTIAPPRVDVVLKKRLGFALGQLRDTARLSSFPAGVTISSESLTAYLEVLLSNFEHNERLISLIDNLSAGNIRRALEFVSRFIGSGHVDTRKILGIFEREGDYVIALHEFLRAIIYGDAEHYDPDVSPIANMFGISQPDGREHFLLGLLIAHVESAGDRKGTEGFVPTDEVYAFGQKCGFSPDQIAWALDRGVKKGLVERSPRGRGLGTHEHLRVTSAGVYTARILIHMFAYVDAVVVDTPIVDANYRKLITTVRDVTERLRRTDLFRVYLDRQWRTLSGAVDNLPFNWEEHSRRLRGDIETVRRKNQP